MDPTERNPSDTTASSRPDELRTRDDKLTGVPPGQTGATYDEGSMAEGMSAGSSTTYTGTPQVSTTRESSGLGSSELGTSSRRDERIGTGTDSYWDNEGPGPRIMAADTLEGDTVVNAAGEDLGEIKDIMIDVPSGRVAYAVLSFGGFLGIGDKLFAIPWQALQLDPENHRFVLDVDKERLRAAPGFDKDHWPSMADERWAVEIHEYYSSRPYWE